MRISGPVREVLGWYDGERPGVKANLARSSCMDLPAAPGGC